jgi:hypothetical protein
MLADSVGVAMLVVLETLTPAERVAFVLHDMFAVPFDEIAPIVGRSPTAARPMFSGRARVTQPALINGAPGAVWAPAGRPRVVFEFTIADGRIVEIDLLADPGHLRQLDLVVLGG